MLFIYLSGDLVAWYTHKRHVVDVSSSEDACIAVLDACKDGLNMYYFMNDFVYVNLHIHVLMDNQ